MSFQDNDEFCGFVARDAEPKISKKGTSYFVLSVGEKQDDGGIRWIRTNVFDRNAVARDFPKGTEVHVHGRLSHDTWTGMDGQERSGWSCMARKVRVTKPRRA